MKDWISADDRMPENKQRVLIIFLTKLGKRRITIAEYIKPKTILEEDFLDSDYSEGFAEYDEEKDCYWAPGGFYESQYETDVNFYLHEQITHWMSLPELPEEV